MRWHLALTCFRGLKTIRQWGLWDIKQPTFKAWSGTATAAAAAGLMFIISRQNNIKKKKCWKFDSLFSFNQNWKVHSKFNVLICQYVQWIYLVSQQPGCVLHLECVLSLKNVICDPEKYYFSQSTLAVSFGYVTSRQAGNTLIHHCLLDTEPVLVADCLGITRKN